MPQASEMQETTRKKFLVWGPAGSGKTSLFRTLPGRKFLYMFDPAGMNSIKPTDDIFYESFLPEVVSMSVVNLKGSKDGEGALYNPDTVYTKWEKDFENRLKKNWFNDPSVEIDGVKGGFDVIGIDSLTTLADLIMDRILSFNNRQGRNPEISDYGILANTIASITRNLNATNCHTYMTAHEEAVQNKLLKTVSVEIMVTGKLKAKLPILFSDIFHAVADRTAQGQMIYTIDTAPNDLYKTARCSMDLKPTEDVTIPVGTADPTRHGLGKFLRDKGFVTTNNTNAK